MQKHALVEADIAIQADRVKAVGIGAHEFSGSGNGENVWLEAGSRREKVERAITVCCLCRLRAL